MKTVGTIANKNTLNLKENTFVESDLSLSHFDGDFKGRTTLPKKGHQIDVNFKKPENYEGPIDPQTRLRHGIGIYRFPNKFFTFEGNYNQGVKEGEGTLKLADGTIIKGTFLNNQLTGKAEISYPDGSSYVGNLLNGEKSGFGTYKSKLESYEGEYISNQKHGNGVYKTRNCTISGTFSSNKAHGTDIQITKYNYEFRGECVNGLKNGKGVEISTYVNENYRYDGEFKDDSFNGLGVYENNNPLSSYLYDGNFSKGIPSIYPNCFRVLVSTAIGLSSEKPNIETYTNITSEQNIAIPLEYELEQENQLYFIIESCYQAPEELDPNQPTEEEIEKMIKDWQLENKKNKNPPPMPDFKKPRMIKPALIVVEQESSRKISVKLIKTVGEQTELLKIDYREEMKNKRTENETIKIENAKKAEEEGTKKGTKTNNKNEIELKVNAFKAEPSEKEKELILINKNGQTEIEKLEFPDDFPIGNYQISITSTFNLFGNIKEILKNFIIKPKNVGKKK